MSILLTFVRLSALVVLIANVMRYFVHRGQGDYYEEKTDLLSIITTGVLFIFVGVLSTFSNATETMTNEQGTTVIEESIVTDNGIEVVEEKSQNEHAGLIKDEKALKFLDSKAATAIALLISFLCSSLVAVGMLWFRNKKHLEEKRVYAELLAKREERDREEEKDLLKKNAIDTFGERIDKAVKLANKLSSKDVPGAFAKELRRTAEVLAGIKKETDESELRGSIEKFSNIYLPTYTKLLQSYKDIMASETKTKHQEATMREIEKIAPDITKAFENILESVTQDDLWDTQTDSKVLLQMMTSDGIISDGNNVLPFTDPMI